MKDENQKQEKEGAGVKRPSNVRAYFTKELNDQVVEMSAKQMEGLLKEFITTPYWIAMLKYTGLRMQYLDVILRGTDPVKEPSRISWAQGALSGLSDLESYVIYLQKSSRPTVEEQEGSAESMINS